MARKNTKSTKSDASDNGMKRTTYKQVANVLVDGSHIAMSEGRSYGEGQIVALMNAIQKELENNPSFAVDTSTMTPYGCTLKNGAAEIVLSVVWADTQCPRCGAPRNAQNEWCSGCMGNTEVDLEAQMAELKAQFS